MLKRLGLRLKIIFTGAFMGLVTVVLLLFLKSDYQSGLTEDGLYVQRMASLIIYLLEAETEEPELVLADYEREMGILSLLKGQEGEILYQSAAGESLEKLLEKAQSSLYIQKSSGEEEETKVTQQEGSLSARGESGEGYFVTSARVHTRTGKNYELALFYRQRTFGEVFREKALQYAKTWLLFFAGTLGMACFLVEMALKPTTRMMKSQKDFIAAASHELKSPLAVIRASTEALQGEEPGGEQLRAGLGIIDAESSRMARLVKDLLLLSSSDAGSWSLQRGEVNVDTLLISLYEAYEPICRRRGIRLELELGEASFPTLYTDRERLAQLLGIYLDNAAAYAPEKSRVELRARLEKRSLTFQVADHGQGIPEKDRPFLFDRFYRGERSRTDKSHFGLGLSIAGELSRLLGGKAGFTDTPGGGATFFFSLPYASGRGF